jgi:carboxymethylenebutenolidase
MTTPRTEADVLLSKGRAMRVALELPAGTPPEGGWPGVVVLHEIFGLTEEIRAVGRRFADAGWAAAIPDYFSAGTKLGCLVKAAREVNTHKPGQVSEDLAAVAGWLGEQSDVNASQLGAIGFCLGGSFALLLGAVDAAGLKGVSVNYGDIPDVATIAQLPPVIGSYGGKDKMFAPKAKVLEERLGACGITHDVTVYPEAGHSFLTNGKHPIAGVLMKPMSIGYVASAADVAWPKIFAFLDEHVRG